TLACVDGIVVALLPCRDQTAGGPDGAGSGRVLARGQPSVAGVTVAHAYGHAIEIGLEDHIGYAAHSVGAIDGGCAVGNDLEALHRLNRNSTDVHALGEPA